MRQSCLAIHMFMLRSGEKLTLHHHRIPFVLADALHPLEHILDIPMAPVLALDGGDGCDVCVALASVLILGPCMQ